MNGKSIVASIPASAEGIPMRSRVFSWRESELEGSSEFNRSTLEDFSERKVKLSSLISDRDTRKDFLVTVE